MRLPAVFAVAAVVLATAAGCGSSPPAGVSDLRVCGAAGWDPTHDSCGTDQRDTSLVSNAFYCSASVNDRAGEQYSRHWTYQGEPLFKGRDSLPDRSRLTVHMILNELSVGGQEWTGPLPAGKYRCELSVGNQTEFARFVSIGPRSSPVAVCPAAADDASGGCPTDQSTATYKPRKKVTCSALIAGGTSPLVFELIHGGQVVVSKRLGLAPLVNAHEQLRNLTRGVWTCRFSRTKTTFAVERTFKVS